MSTDIRRSRDSPADFGELYYRHASVIYRYAARRAGGFAADDVTSETFLVDWEQLETYDLDRDDARPWLFGIAIRHVGRAPGPAGATDTRTPSQTSGQHVRLLAPSGVRRRRW
ncbi:RNA polymerase sigma factor [Pseudarthrobacter sp. H2]|uniref:RNA polymerase sigma factor n=1 Tax=Pseudarthrobacter sp. H2 TaxID=3418415 RepID=UPI003CF95030